MNKATEEQLKEIAYVIDSTNGHNADLVGSIIDNIGKDHCDSFNDECMYDEIDTFAKIIENLNIPTVSAIAYIVDALIITGAEREELMKKVGQKDLMDM